MPGRLLIDTDVIIDYLRDQSDAVAYMEDLTEFLQMPTITMAELYAGVRGGAERYAFETFTKVFEIIPVNRKIAVKGGLYRRD